MRTTATRAISAAIAASLALGGCSIFRSDDKKAEAAEAEQVAQAARFEPIETVRHVEIGRTRNGYVISAQGYAPGLGYGAPELRPRREGKPGPDGFIDYDFVARAPDPGFNLGEGTLQARAIRADLQIEGPELRGATGIRIHGVKGGVQLTF